MSVLFHGNFGLYRDRLAKILEAGLKHPEHNDKQLAEPLGYGAPFASKYRSWLHKTGLTAQKLPVSLTEMGQVVFQNDPQLEKTVTIAFLHHELTSTDRAFAWHFFVNEFLPKHESFTRDNLVGVLATTIQTRSLGSGNPQKMAGIIARKLIECYTEDYSLGSLGLLKKEKTVFVRNEQTTIAGPWNTAGELSAAYSS